MFTATSKGADNLYRVPLAGGAPQLVAQGGAISAPQIGPDFVVVLEGVADLAGRALPHGPARLGWRRVTRR